MKIYIERKYILIKNSLQKKTIYKKENINNI